MVERKEETAMKKEYLDKIAEYGQLTAEIPKTAPKLSQKAGKNPRKSS